MKFAVILILFLAFPGGVYADSPDFLSLFRFDFGVQEEYTDNVDYSPSNTRDDWITRVYGGVRLSTELAPERPGRRVQEEPMGRNPWGINLDYRLAYNYYAKDTYDAYFSHEREGLGYLGHDRQKGSPAPERLSAAIGGTLGVAVSGRGSAVGLSSGQPENSGEVYSQCAGAVCGIPVREGRPVFL